MLFLSTLFDTGLAWSFCSIFNCFNLHKKWCWKGYERSLQNVIPRAGDGEFALVGHVDAFQHRALAFPEEHGLFKCCFQVLFTPRQWTLAGNSRAQNANAGDAHVGLGEGRKDDQNGQDEGISCAHFRPQLVTDSDWGEQSSADDGVVTHKRLSSGKGQKWFFYWGMCTFSVFSPFFRKKH